MVAGVALHLGLLTSKARIPKNTGGCVSSWNQAAFWNCGCAPCAGSSTTSQWRPSEKWRTSNSSSEKHGQFSCDFIESAEASVSISMSLLLGSYAGLIFPSIFRLVHSILDIWKWTSFLATCHSAGSFGGHLHWLPRPWHRVPWQEKQENSWMENFFLRKPPFSANIFSLTGIQGLRIFILKGLIFNRPEDPRWSEVAGITNQLPVLPGA